MGQPHSGTISIQNKPAKWNPRGSLRCHAKRLLEKCNHKALCAVPKGGVGKVALCYKAGVCVGRCFSCVGGWVQSPSCLAGTGEWQGAQHRTDKAAILDSAGSQPGPSRAN